MGVKSLRDEFVWFLPLHLIPLHIIDCNDYLIVGVNQNPIYHNVLAKGGRRRLRHWRFDPKRLGKATLKIFERISQLMVKLSHNIVRYRAHFRVNFLLKLQLYLGILLTVADQISHGQLHSDHPRKEQSNSLINDLFLVPCKELILYQYRKQVKLSLEKGAGPA